MIIILIPLTIAEIVDYFWLLNNNNNLSACTCVCACVRARHTQREDISNTNIWNNYVEVKSKRSYSVILYIGWVSINLNTGFYTNNDNTSYIWSVLIHSIHLSKINIIYMMPSASLNTLTISQVDRGIDKWPSAVFIMKPPAWEWMS